MDVLATTEMFGNTWNHQRRERRSSSPTGANWIKRWRSWRCITWTSGSKGEAAADEESFPMKFAEQYGVGSFCERRVFVGQWSPFARSAAMAVSKLGYKHG